MTFWVWGIALFQMFTLFSFLDPLYWFNITDSFFFLDNTKSFINIIITLKTLLHYILLALYVNVHSDNEKCHGKFIFILIN